MSGINLSALDFTAEQVRAVGELFFDEVINAPALTDSTTLFDGIVFGKQVGYIGEAGMLGHADQGCGENFDEWEVPVRGITWEPKSWEAAVKLCYADLETSAAVYSLKKGVQIGDLTSTDYMAIIANMFKTSVVNMAFRYAWFGKTTATGTDADKYTLLDGFFTKLLAQATTNTSQRVTITENEGASYSAQALSKDNIQGYLEALVYGAPLELRGAQNNVILCTQSFYDAYAKSLQGTQITELYQNLVNGQPTLTYNGVPLVPMIYWDKILTTGQFNDGTKVDAPHRAVYTNKNVLGVAVDSRNSWGGTDIFYDRRDKTTLVRAMGKMDVQVLNPNMFMLAI